MGGPLEPLHGQVLVVWVSALADHPSAAPYQILSLFHEVWESENILKMFPPAPSDLQGLNFEFSGIAVLSACLGLVSQLQVVQVGSEFPVSDKSR